MKDTTRLIRDMKRNIEAEIVRPTIPDWLMASLLWSAMLALALLTLVR
jgi:hypothetical protein